MTCIYCEEEVSPTDQFTVYADGSKVHRECHFRSFIGSVGHQKKLCSCYVEGATDGDPEGMTRRQAALAAVAYYYRMNPIPTKLRGRL